MESVSQSVSYLVYSYVAMARSQRHINVMGELKYYTRSIDIFFRLNLISKLFRIPKICKSSSVLKLCPFPLRMKFYIPNMCSFLIGLFPLHAMTSDFNGDISISNCSVVLCTV